VPETVQEEGGLLPKASVLKSGLLESGVGELDGLDDFVTMGLKGEALVEEGAPLGREVGWGIRRRRRFWT
jgi:hypothetical protein